MGLEILKSIRNKQNLQFLANKFNVTVDVIRNNYFSWFWRCGYITKAEKGLYTLSEKGKEKIKNTEILYKIDDMILREVKKRMSNKEIISLIKEKYNINWTDGQVHGKILRYKKKFDIYDRRKVYYNIPKNFSPKLAELIGLIFSDGCINRYGISFYNKDNALLGRFQYLVFKVFNLDNPCKRERRPKFFEINYYSINVADYLNKLIQKKSTVPKQILEGGKDIKTSFLRGFFSGDGCVILSIPHKKFYHKFQINSFLFLACRRMNITKIIGKIFVSLGYNVIVRNDGLQIHRIKDIFKFYREIGFVNNSKIADYSRNWKGFEKNQILKYIATALKEDKELHGLRYGNRNLAIKHIQSRLDKIVSKNYQT